MSVYEPKNIVVCLDGTGNQIEENISNVLKLYRTLDKGKRARDRQVAFYDQGIGTVGQQYTWGRLWQKTGEVWGLATGAGLDRNVLRAYDFIARNYREEENKGEDGGAVTQRDRIFLFGYSRGAHTARVLAALIYNLGILRPEQLHLAGAALTAYKRANNNRGLEEVEHFNRITQPLRPAVEFIGVWDTVSSMIVPRRDRVLVPAIEKLRNTRENPAVRMFRHAMSIDEARYMFRLDPWVEDQSFKPNPQSKDTGTKQDCLQVWFAGHHGDVGGGNLRADSGLSQYPLCWMIKEAMKAGLLFNTRMVDYVALGIPYTEGTEYNYPKPDPAARIHASRRSGWAVLEWLPKLARYREWKGKGKRTSILGVYIPRWEPRPVPENAFVHESAIIRRDAAGSYDPKNFPSTHRPVSHDARLSGEWLK